MEANLGYSFAPRAGETQAEFAISGSLVKQTTSLQRSSNLQNSCSIYKQLVRAKASSRAFVDAKEELLWLAGWRGVQVLAAFYRFECCPQLRLHRGCIVLADR